jgi:hypothetical protein
MVLNNELYEPITINCKTYGSFYLVKKNSRAMEIKVNNYQ